MGNSFRKPIVIASASDNVASFILEHEMSSESDPSSSTSHGVLQRISSSPHTFHELPEERKTSTIRKNLEINTASKPPSPSREINKPESPNSVELQRSAKSLSSLIGTPPTYDYKILRYNEQKEHEAKIAHMIMTTTTPADAVMVADVEGMLNYEYFKEQMHELEENIKQSEIAPYKTLKQKKEWASDIISSAIRNGWKVVHEVEIRNIHAINIVIAMCIAMNCQRVMSTRKSLHNLKQALGEIHIDRQDNKNWQFENEGQLVIGLKNAMTQRQALADEYSAVVIALQHRIFTQGVDQILATRYIKKYNEAQQRKQNNIQQDDAAMAAVAEIYKPVDTSIQIGAGVTSATAEIHKPTQSKLTSALGELGALRIQDRITHRNKVTGEPKDLLNRVKDTKGFFFYKH